MSLVGRLEDLALSDIFQIISLSKKTGTLILKNKAKGSAVVVFRNGQIVQAATDNLRDTLGNILISKGSVSENDLTRALETQKRIKGTKRLGQIMVEMGAISQEVLEETIRGQIENMIYSLLAWEEGFFNFDLGDITPSDKIEVVTHEFLLKAGLNPEYLLMESARVMDEKKRDKKTKPAPPAPAPEAKKKVSEFAEFLQEQGVAPQAEPSLEERAAADRGKDLNTLKSMFEELRFPSATAEITLLVLRYASEVVNRAVLFMVTRDEVRGLGQFGIEYKDESPDKRVRDIKVPTKEASIFSEVIRDKRVKIGGFSDSAWDIYMIKELGGQGTERIFSGAGDKQRQGGRDTLRRQPPRRQGHPEYFGPRDIHASGGPGNGESASRTKDFRPRKTAGKGERLKPMAYSVLIVEDSKAMRGLIRATVEQMPGFSTFEAASGFDALKVLPARKYDLIITDINMPDINGLELISFVKGHPQYKEIPLIIVSTERSDEDRERGLSLGASGYIVKPFKGNELQELVRKVLE